MAYSQSTNYYVNQAGSGIGGFNGNRYQWRDQQGDGLLDILKMIGMPLLRYLGKKAFNTGLDIAQDAASGENIVKSAKSRLKRTARDLIGDAAQRASKFAQTGRGKRKKLGRKVKKSVQTKVFSINTRSRKSKTKRKTKRRQSAKKNNNLFF